jgi:hypothetical protein
MTSQVKIHCGITNISNLVPYYVSETRMRLLFCVKKYTSKQLRQDQNRLALYGCRLKSHSWSDNMSQTCISQKEKPLIAKPMIGHMFILHHIYVKVILTLQDS